MKRTLILITTIIGGLTTSAQNQNLQEKLPLVEQFLDSVVAEWKIPGLAIGIVHKDQLLYAGSFGYRDLRQKLPVDSKTIFPIASNTKLFTSVLAVMLQEEGLLNIDEPVRNYSTELRFSTDDLNARTTLRDILSHRTGLPRYDGIWKNANLNSKELIERIPFMKPNLGFREAYQYNNIMYGAAGYLMETLTGLAWSELVSKRLLKPLQMDSTCFLEKDAEINGNFARSYYTPLHTNEFLERKFLSQPEALYPSCLIKSNVEDMSHWMAFLLNSGIYNGEKIIEKESLQKTMKPNSIVDEESIYQELSHPMYGLGRRLLMYKGLHLTMHTGSINGFYSNMSLLPNEQLGIFIVHNYCNAGCYRLTLALPIIDRLWGLSETDWNTRWKVEYQVFQNKILTERQILSEKQVLNTRPSHPLSHYAGSYTNPVYGEMTIKLINNQLQFDFRSQQCKLYHYHYDQFITKETMADEPDFYLAFLTNSEGAIEKISCSPYGDPVVEFIKTKGRK